VSGFLTRHFRRHLLPGTEGASHYEPLQRLTYLIVIFALFPLIVVTGLAMSPAVTSVVPWIATVKGIGKGWGGGAPEAGYSWYAGI
jgi:thiosulfate reductase cytochrome b subunit